MHDEISGGTAMIRPSTGKKGHKSMIGEAQRDRGIPFIAVYPLRKNPDSTLRPIRAHVRGELEAASQSVGERTTLGEMGTRDLSSWWRALLTSGASTTHSMLN